MAEGKSQFCLGKCPIRRDGQNPPPFISLILETAASGTRWRQQAEPPGLLHPKVHPLLYSHLPQSSQLAVREGTGQKSSAERGQAVSGWFGAGFVCSHQLQQVRWWLCRASGLQQCFIWGTGVSGMNKAS